MPIPLGNEVRMRSENMLVLYFTDLPELDLATTKAAPLFRSHSLTSFVDDIAANVATFKLYQEIKLKEQPL